MKKAANTVTRRIGDQALLLPLRPVGQGLWAYELNEAAAFVWERLDGKAGIPELAARLREEFDLPEETALQDVEELISDLRSLGVIE